MNKAIENTTETTANTVETAQSERLYTCFGSWDEDELTIDYTVEGEVEDHRPDEVNGYQSFCASATASSPEEAEKLVLEEYAID
jgi:hypothetical protein